MGCLQGKISMHRSSSDSQLSRRESRRRRSFRSSLKKPRDNNNVPLEFQRLSLFSPERPLRIKFRSREEIEHQMYHNRRDHHNHSASTAMRRQTHPIPSYHCCYSPMGGVTYAADGDNSDGSRYFDESTSKEECLLLTHMSQQWEARRCAGERRFSYIELDTYSSPNRYLKVQPRHSVSIMEGRRRDSVAVKVEPPTPDTTDREEREEAVRRKRRTHAPRTTASPGQHQRFQIQQPNSVKQGRI